MIKSFKDKATAAIFTGRFVRHAPREVQPRVKRRLEQLHAARGWDDLKQPPSNHLEALHGNRAGQWSIRVNDQWRICFRFEEGHAFDVELTDYH